ncbi:MULTISPECIES: zinc ribbon domain-containing protein [unclassified Lactonifactor]|uniref:zinc ribbon domain-containing protein n=1 Tax=unclassified Lactonifactor TaxID=2636670 RepID=UPI0015661DFF|nr:MULTISPECIES: zinc ribbon domain-containing protein [unclassified Lactonifactor]
MLSGFIYCGKCGARFHGEHGNYSCYSRTKGDKKYIVDPNCKNKKWKIPDLDAVVTDYICHFEFESLEKEAVNDVPAPDYSKRITEIDKQIGRMLDLYQLGSIPIDIISKKVDDLYKEKETLQTAEIPQQRHISIEELLQARDKFISVLNGGSLEEKRACLSLLIKRIEIDDDKVNIILNEL